MPNSPDFEMFEPQNVMDLPENSGFGDLRSWLPGDSGDADGGSSGAGRNLDRVLFNDLVEIVPLVQSLIVQLLLMLSFVLYAV